MVSRFEDDPDEPSADECGAFLGRLLFVESESPTRSAIHDSQQFIYEAWDAETDEEMIAYLVRALELNPRNPDGLLTLLDMSEWSGEKEIEALRRILQFAADELGEEAFEEFVPHFWGFLETRPYMRVRGRLGEGLLREGRLSEAAAEFEAMLDLNENDNQGLRYELLPCYLAESKLKEVGELMSRYPNDLDFNAVFSWGRVLERFLSEERDEAKKALDAARRQNPHAEGYASGRRRLPRSTPDTYSPGSQEEAKCYADLIQLSWKPHREARRWLREQTGK